MFVTNAFALLGLRALYFVLEGALGALEHLSYGLAAILGFIGFKLVLHWAHLVWPSVPDVPTLMSLFVIIGILGITIATSLVANKRKKAARPSDEAVGNALTHGSTRTTRTAYVSTSGVAVRREVAVEQHDREPVAEHRAGLPEVAARYSTTSTWSPYTSV